MEEEWYISYYLKEQILDFSILLLLFLTVILRVLTPDNIKTRMKTQSRKL